MGSCFDPPEFENNPTIDLEDLYFVDNPDPAGRDLLSVKLSFRDGNGNLGLPATATDSPFHATNFHVKVGAGIAPVTGRVVTFSGFIRGSTGTQVDNQPYQLIEWVPVGAERLVTLQDRSSAFPSLPPLVSPYTCSVNDTAYTDLNQLIFIEARFKGLVQDKSTIRDSLINPLTNRVAYYGINDNLLIVSNPYNYNIYVKFYIQTSNGQEEYSWPKEFCQTYNGRFPVLNDDDNPLEGNLLYEMSGIGFVPIFGVRPIKLVIYIYDRNFNPSNTVETGWFTLDEIRR